MNIKYFDTIEETLHYVEKYNISEYYFTTPEFLENGVDLNYNQDIIIGEV